jgi:hypothetical protein
MEVRGEGGRFVFLLLSVVGHGYLCFSLEGVNTVQREAYLKHVVPERIVNVQLNGVMPNAIKREHNDIRPHETAFLGTEAANSASSGESESTLLAAQVPQRYYSARELTKKPQLLRDIPSDLNFAVPSVPSSPIVLRLLINESGHVDEVISESDNLTEQESHLLTEIFQTLAFSPGEIDGFPAKAQLKIEVRLDETP